MALQPPRGWPAARSRQPAGERTSDLYAHARPLGEPEAERGAGPDAAREHDWGGSAGHTEAAPSQPKAGNGWSDRVDHAAADTRLRDDLASVVAVENGNRIREQRSRIK